MWLPTKLYERLPIGWVLVGVVFIVCATYLGLSDPAAYGYFGVGVGCSVFGFFIGFLRAQYRAGNSSSEARASSDEIDAEKN